MGENIFPCSAAHEQDLAVPYPGDPCSASAIGSYLSILYIHGYILLVVLILVESHFPLTV